MWTIAVQKPICFHPLFPSFPAWSHLESLSSCPTSACCASFLTHKNKPWCRRTCSLRRNASISMLLEFVDSLVKWNGLDGASNVLFGLLESNKFTEHLFFSQAPTQRMCVCACQDLLVCKTRPKHTNHPLKSIIYLHSVFTLGNRLKSGMGF